MPQRRHAGVAPAGLLEDHRPPVPGVSPVADQLARRHHPPILQRHPRRVLQPHHVPPAQLAGAVDHRRPGQPAVAQQRHPPRLRRQQPRDLTQRAADEPGHRQRRRIGRVADGRQAQQPFAVGHPQPQATQALAVGRLVQHQQELASSPGAQQRFAQRPQRPRPVQVTVGQQSFPAPARAGGLGIAHRGGGQLPGVTVPGRAHRQAEAGQGPDQVAVERPAEEVVHRCGPLPYHPCSTHGASLRLRPQEQGTPWVPLFSSSAV